jgi:predicted alpha/beta hydrolase
MNSLRKELVPIDAGDGTSSLATFFEHRTTPDAPIIVCMPALGVAAHSYRTLAEQLAAAGCVVITADHRGIGESSVRASRATDFGYFETLCVDWPALIDVIRSRHPAGPLFLLGHSLGGQLGALFAAANPGAVNGLILVASCSVFYKGWGFPSGLAVLAGTQMAALIAQLIGYFPGKRLGFGGTEAKRLMRDWARNARTGRYEVERCSHDFEGLLASSGTPVLAISIEGDDFAPLAACQNLTAKLKVAPITTRRVSVVGRSGRSRHFEWLKLPLAISREIEAWLGAQVDLSTD